MRTNGYTRRSLMKMAGVSAVLPLAEQVAALGGDNSRGRPNIVFILIDDLRYDAMSYAGHPFSKTPHIDRLAKEGVLFKNAFVTTSLCSPSRGSFLTGCYAHTHEVFGNAGKDPNPAFATFPQLLQKAGYETAFMGKWHMAATNTPRPGFDHWVSFRGQGNYSKNQLNVDGKMVSSENYITDELTDYAVAFLKKKHPKPFMLYLSHKAVHGPFTPAPRHAKLYSDAQIESRNDPKDNLATKPPWGRQMDADWKNQILAYFQTLAAVDESVGRVLATLEEIDALDNTAVIFAGDNGYFHGEHGGMWDKRAAYEPSMRIPLVMRYPKLAEAGTACSELVLNVDLAPTLLDLAATPIPGAMQGRSWLAAVRGRPGRESFLYEYFQEQGDRFKRPTVLAIRTKNWKYITYPLDSSFTAELYDLQADPGELNNLVGDAKHAETLNQLKAELEKLKQQTGFRLPDASRQRKKR